MIDQEKVEMSLDRNLTSIVNTVIRMVVFGILGDTNHCKESKEA